MIPGVVAGATHRLAPPEDWDQTGSRGRCVALMIRRNESGAMTSAWLPTPEKLARIAAGAPVLLTVVGCGHPPVALEVGEIPE